jgi:hypothetical protein
MAKVSELIDKLIQVINENTACEDYEVERFFWSGGETMTTYTEADKELADTSRFVSLGLLISRKSLQ